MSPLNRSWFLCWDDGTIDYTLPEDIADYVDEYCQLRHSMIPRKSRVRSGGISTGVKASTSLRLLDIGDRYDKEEYSRSERSRDDSGVNEKLLFHGTARHCWLGDGDSFINLCKKSACSLCNILRQSFSVNRASTAPDRNSLRFGHGICTSSVSSKADDYTNEDLNSPHRVLLVARAALGKSKALRQNTQNLRSPPSGYDSVLGEVGYDLNYDE
ncbi:hypothetical protein FS837_011727 [Tulasnella sp. UAMH 9824]|nr:hypothetical protein FS837_011727 [Tulasnella sp. UAMH 9824]